MSEIEEIDFHGMSFFEAQNELLVTIVELVRAGHTAFRLIHGRSGDHVIKTYIFGQYKHDLQRQLPQVELQFEVENPGSTIIHIKTQQSDRTIKPYEKRKNESTTGISSQNTSTGQNVVITIKCKTCGYKQQVMEENLDQKQCKRCRQPL